MKTLDYINREIKKIHDSQEGNRKQETANH